MGGGNTGVEDRQRCARARASQVDDDDDDGVRFL